MTIHFAGTWYEWVIGLVYVVGFVISCFLQLLGTGFGGTNIFGGETRHDGLLGVITSFVWPLIVAGFLVFFLVRAVIELAADLMHPLFHRGKQP